MASDDAENPIGIGAGAAGLDGGADGAGGNSAGNGNENVAASVPANPKRGRGRPRKDGGNGPGSGVGIGSGSSSSGGSGKSRSLDLKNFAGQIKGAHEIAALFFKSELCKIDDKEAEMLAVAIKDITAQYNMVPDPKVAAWLALAGTCATVYGPRVGIAVMAAKIRKQERAQNQPVQQPRETVIKQADPTAVNPQGVYKYQ